MPLDVRFLFNVVEKPEAPPEDKKVSLPPIDWVAVEGPADPNWQMLEWGADVGSVASSSTLGESGLTVYYSRAFPRFASSFARFEKEGLDAAKSFENRYRIWVAVHSLLTEQDKKHAEDIDAFEAKEGDERVRLATIAAMFATREVKEGIAISGADA